MPADNRPGPRRRRPPRRTDSGRDESGRERWRFEGWIAGVGTSEGTRLVVGHWVRSPLGAFTDVMVERADGHRVLLAPTAVIAAFVAATYHFDSVVETPLRLAIAGDGPRGQRWTVTAGPLALRFLTGARTSVGWALSLVPDRLARRPAFATAINPVAARLQPGVRTVGSAGNGRREWYAALDVHRIVLARATWRGDSLGDLAAVDPPVRFGFASTPRLPVLTRVVTTVEVPSAHETGSPGPG